MSKKNIIFIILTAIIIISSLILVYLFFFQPDNSEKININTNSGSLQINDIIKQNKYLLSDNSIIIAENDNYIINYDPDIQVFSISISNVDFVKARKMVEKDLLKILGINKKQACQLQVNITTPYGYNEYGGETYFLSYCEKK